jgi:photosystem II stability/assembly factor-like uncharacterized protein
MAARMMRKLRISTLIATILGLLCTLGVALIGGAHDASGLSAPPRERWHLIGPSPWMSDGLPENSFKQRYSGRVTAVAGDPSDANTIYLGAFGGGVWKTIDRGLTWQPLTDSADSLNISCLELNGATIYAGTAAVTANSAIGVLKSTDAGAHWINVGRGVFNRHSVLRIVTEGSHPEVVYAAVGEIQTQGVPGAKGVWKSTNGGIDWTLTTKGSLPAGADVSFNDLVIDPLDPRRVYATVSEFTGDSSLNGVWASLDSGGHWARVLTPREITPQLNAKYTTKIALEPNSPNVLYVASADAPSPLAREDPELLPGKLSIFKSEDGGQSWVVLPTPPGAGCPQACQPFLGNAYTLTLAVDPFDPNIVYLADNKREGSFSISADGGLSWKDHHIDQYGYTPHADHRAAGFDAAGNYLEGDDGGIACYHRMEDRWEDFNSTLSVTQFNTIQIHPNNPQMVYGGGIDSGLNWRSRGTPLWARLPAHNAMGDLGAVRLDRQHPEIVFAQFTGCQNCTANVLQRSTDGGRSFVEMHTGITEVGGTPPFAIDPANTAHLLLGTSRLYESMDSASTWRPIFTFDGTGRTRVTALAIAAGGDAIYAWTNNRLMASHDHGGSFQAGALVPDRQDAFVNIAVSPRSGETAYAVGAGVDHPNVYATHDGGRSWYSIHNDLPNTSANAIVVDARGSQDTLYVGIDGGVYISSNEGASWRRYGVGLPNGSAKALDINTNFGVLVVGLNGRGAWQIGISNPIDGGRR